ncbi:MAG TPA: tyrosine--tRNA ligase [Candidatus Kerfeldbacteria bacterium]|nr:tyrosine--tRNA ligase [Candidatus Kerfeldbacteria bacterium]
MIDSKTILQRGVDTIYPSAEALAAVMQQKKITLYLGVDPTGALLHIGHTVALRKLAQFQQAGHKVILLIGDFTGRIGDPTGKDKTRVPLTPEQLAENAQTYKDQAAKILDFNHPENPVEIRYNSTWLAKLTFADVIKLASHFTVQQMLERDMFEQRLNDNKPISLHEFFYPLMQGYDSVAMDVDLEVGGTDQTFNMLAGRTLQKEINHREKFVLTVPLLADSRGVKIGKTEGNVIAITAEPADLYGKIMALGDDVVRQCFELCTNVAMAEVDKKVAAEKNPKETKMWLAREIVTLYHDAAAAQQAEAEFEKVFSEHGKPTDMPQQPVPTSTEPLEVLMVLGLATNKTAAKRLFEQGGVKLNDVKVTDWKAPLELKSGDILQVGKRNFVELS